MNVKLNSPARLRLALAGVASSCALLGCQANAAPSAEQIQTLAKKTKEQLVLVKGGQFQMGDFGEIHSDEKLPYSSQPDDGPLHHVTVSDFYIAKYKVTLADYDLYAAANKLPLPYMTDKGSDKRVRAHPKSPTFPVGVDWQEARNYCQWIGKQAGQAMDLPTEAQWEYAARARGAMRIFVTDNGKEEPGRNFPTIAQIEAVNGRTAGDLPVGLYPPNPLGLYDMGFNGSDWILDWYDEAYYSQSPAIDPQGPPKGVRKVIRGQGNSAPHPAMTFQRDSREPALANATLNRTNRNYSFRCVAPAVKQ